MGADFDMIDAVGRPATMMAISPAITTGRPADPTMDKKGALSHKSDSAAARGVQQRCVLSSSRPTAT